MINKLKLYSSNYAHIDGRWDKGMLHVVMTFDEAANLIGSTVELIRALRGQSPDYKAVWCDDVELAPITIAWHDSQAA